MVFKLKASTCLERSEIERVGVALQLFSFVCSPPSKSFKVSPTIMKQMILVAFFLGLAAAALVAGQGSTLDLTIPEVLKLPINANRVSTF